MSSDLRCETCSHWQCYKPTSVSCDSPEAALRAALGA